MTSVLIVEDEPELLRRLVAAVAAAPGLRLVDAVDRVETALARIDAYAPDVVLVDLGLPDGHGVEVIRRAVTSNALCDVLVVTMFGDDGNVFASIEAGATGYLVKDALPVDIVAAIHEVRRGGAPISPAIARRVLRHVKLLPTSVVQCNAEALVPAAEGGPPKASISVREIEVLRLVGKGLNFKEIGALLGLSPHTITTHVKNIYRKLAVHSRGEAVYEASQLGIL